MSAVTSFQFLQFTKAGTIQPKFGVTGLHLAASFGLADQVRSFLHHGYDARPVDSMGMTPLLWAIEEGQTTVVKLFLKTGSIDVDLRYPFEHILSRWPKIWPNEKLPKVPQAYSSPTGLGFRTLLTHAIEAGFPDIVKILLDSDAETEYVYCLPMPIFDCISEKQDGLYEFAKSYFEVAYSIGSTVSVEVVGKLKERVKQRDNRDAFSEFDDLEPDPPSFKRLMGKMDKQDVLREFQDLGNNLGSRTFHKPAGIRTPLSRAAELGNGVIVKLLLDHGARVELKEQGGKDAMTRAKEKGHWDILRLLVENRGR
ncbi:hypothetical protein CDV31_009977 [Fusarium ambrosium]|uniref:Ankyrin n=1 Tax=Fusarium ambrosium TaxID=131363 RepID=A0A428TRJ0_9HYPO|nr:hypothetical protein CDV31_009977 [Fusarium ambrosium]